MGAWIRLHPPVASHVITPSTQDAMEAPVQSRAGLSRSLEASVELCSIVYGQRSPDTHPRGAYFVPSGQSVRRFALSSKSGGGEGGEASAGRPVNRLYRGRRRSWRTVRVKKHYRNQSCFEIGRVLVRCMGRTRSRHPFRTLVDASLHVDVRVSLRHPARWSHGWSFVGR